MALTVFQDNNVDGLISYACGFRTGTRTEPATWTVTLGFTPYRVKVVDLTSRIQGEYISYTPLQSGTNVYGLLTAAAGSRTYADLGIRILDKSFTVTIATAGLSTDNDDVFWECWGQ